MYRMEETGDRWIEGTVMVNREWDWEEDGGNYAAASLLWRNGFPGFRKHFSPQERRICWVFGPAVAGNSGYHSRGSIQGLFPLQVRFPLESGRVQFSLVFIRAD